MFGKTDPFCEKIPDSDPPRFNKCKLNPIQILSMEDYPTIDPTTFDVVIAGTSLPSSLLAAASSALSKSVLHLDPNSFYGSTFSSLPPSTFSSSTLLSSPPNLLELSGSLPEPSGASFSLDLAGPRLLFCADPLVDLLIRSGASNHVEFKSVEGSLIYWNGGFVGVPDSRQAIFRDKSLGLGEKREMMRFLKMVQGYIGNDDDDVEQGGGVRVEEDDLEMPFVDFLNKQKLPPKIRTIILYAIVLADYDQDKGESCKKLIKTKEGIETIALYIKSVGRFPNAVGAFIYPMYGHAELPQAFCRCAAVKGALYVLRMPVVDLLMDEEKRKYNGVKLASGQEIFCNHLIMEPSTVPSSVSNTPGFVRLDSSNQTLKVARGVCITNRSIQQDLSNLLVIFPPRSLYPEQSTTVRALQLSSNVAVCPHGMFLVYLSTPCEDTNLGKEYLRAAMNALFSTRNLNISKESVSNNNESAEESNGILLWSALYVQEVAQASFDTCCLCPMPDASLDYRDLLQSTMKLFTSMYPHEEFLPVTPASENAEDDSGSSDLL